MSYQESLAYLYSLQKLGIKLGLANIRRLLELLGNPHSSLKTVLVGGTNGKGSTAAMLAKMLAAGGYKVGLYTSPHLDDFRERIKVGDSLIPEARVVELTARMRKALALGSVLIPITFFEAVTALAYLHFNEEEIDLAVLEVGMGGRLDATNTTRPLLSIITSVSRDHCQHLGSSLEQILAEKLEIARPGQALVSGITARRLTPLVKRYCRDRGAELFSLNKDFSYLAVRPRTMNYHGLSGSIDGLKLGLSGEHQMSNAALALAGGEILIHHGFDLRREHFRQGLKEVTWPGRLELIPTLPPVLLDIAHNPAGATALARALRKEYNWNSLVIVLGIMADKDWPGVMRALLPLADKIITTRPQLPRACPPEELAGYAKRRGVKVEIVPRVSEAVRQALERAGEDEMILVTGSIFTVSEARRFLCSLLTKN